ncbi:MAG: hypothetical protein EA353_00605 [Puniceicoccaceae bacterium]|nr:MAG: hypothetical protein EA353_00605 [Puniceicoccaceae bacterium]
MNTPSIWHLNPKTEFHEAKPIKGGSAVLISDVEAQGFRLNPFRRFKPGTTAKLVPDGFRTVLFPAFCQAKAAANGPVEKAAAAADTK